MAASSYITASSLKGMFTSTSSVLVQIGLLNVILSSL